MEIINKTSEPQCLIEIKKRIKPPYNGDEWENKSIANERHALRVHILENEQNFHCAFCGVKLHSERTKADSEVNNHIDHFIKRELDSSLTFDYNNMFVSCNSNNHCACYKDIKLKSLNKSVYEALSVNQQLIKPSENITRFICYDFAGFPHEKGSESDKIRAKNTIIYFNLACEELRHRKKSIVIPLLNALAGIKTDEDFEKFKSDNSKELEKLPTDYKIYILPIMKNIKGNLEYINPLINNTIQESSKQQFKLYKQQ